MKKLTVLLTISFLTVLTNCSNSNTNYDHWTEEEMKNLKKKCSETDSFNDMIVLFHGFENSEFDSVLIKEYKDTLLLGSFRVFVWPAESPDDKRDKDRSATIDRTMNINYRYEFVVPGQRPYELKDMKMVIWSQETENSDGYGCVMGDFTLDDVVFEQIGNPSIIKRDTTNKK